MKLVAQTAAARRTSVLYLAGDAKETKFVNGAFQKSHPHLVVEFAVDASDTRRRLREGDSYDALVVGWSVPEPEAVALIGFVRQHALPVAVVAAGERGLDRLAQAGADECVLRGASFLARLPEAIEEGVLKRQAADAAAPAEDAASPIRLAYAGDLSFLKAALGTDRALLMVYGLPQALAGGLPCDVVALDHGARDADTAGTLADVRSRVPGVPVVLLVDPPDETPALRTFGSTIDEFLVKTPGWTARLATRLATVCARHQQIQEFAALQQREARMRALVDRLPACVVRVSPEGTVLAMNPVALSLVGAAELRQLLRKPFQALVTPDQIEPCGDFIQRVSEGHQRSLELTLTTLTGEMRPVDVTAVPLPPEDGRPSSVLMVLRDARDRKRLERALEEAQRPAVESAVVPPPQIEPSTETAQLETPQLETPQLETPQLETPQLETPQPETQPETVRFEILRFEAPADAPVANDIQVTEDLLTEEVVVVDVPDVDVPDVASEEPVAAIAAPPEPEPTDLAPAPPVLTEPVIAPPAPAAAAAPRAIDPGLDVASLREMEADLERLCGRARTTFQTLEDSLRDAEAQHDQTLARQQEEQTKLEAAQLQRWHEYDEWVRAASHGVLQVGADDAIVDANAAFASLLGYGSPAAIVAAAGTPGAVTDETRWRAALETWRAGGGGNPLETRWRRTDGALLVLRLTARTRTGPGAAEARLEIAAENLTVQRTLDAQIRRSRRWEEVARLTTGIAADLKHVIEDLSQSSGRLSSGDAGDDRVHAAAIQTSAAKALTLSGQLVAFGRKGARGPESLDVNVTVQALESVVRRLVDEAIELSLDLAASLEAIEAERPLLEEVCVGLAVAAGDALPAGGSVRITTANLDVESRGGHPVEPGAYVLLSVEAHGWGVSPLTSDAGGLVPARRALAQLGGALGLEHRGDALTLTAYLPQAPVSAHAAAAGAAGDVVVRF